MGKRFGRNQRRRMREELAHAQSDLRRLQIAHAMDSALLRHQRLQIEELQAQLNDVRDALGPDWIGLPPRELVLHIKGLDFGDSFRARGLSGAAIEVATMRVDVHSDDMRDQMDFRVRLGSSAVGYAISHRAMRDAPAQFIARRLADEMAPALLRDIRTKEKARV